MFSKLAVHLSIVLLAGCSAPTRFSEQPDLTTTPATWSTASTSPKAQTAPPARPLPYRSWLSNFNDLQLDQLVDVALSNSGTMLAARLEADAAGLDAQATGTLLGPQLDFVLNTSRETGASETDPNRLANSNEYQIELAAQWEVDVWGQNRGRVRASELEFERATELAEAAKLSLVGLVAKAWFTLLSLEQQKEIDQQRIASFSNTERSVLEQVARGIKNTRDLDVARTELHQAKADLEATIRQHNVQQKQLQILLGTYQKPAFDLTIGLRDLDADWRLEAPVTQLLNRPDLRASFLAVEQADAETAAAYGARFPQFTLTANVGRTAASFGDLSNGISAVSKVVANLIVPIIDATNRELNQERQERLAEIAATRFRDDLLTAFYEVEETIANEKFLREELKALSEALVWAERSSRTSLSSYRRGLIGVVDLLAAKRTVLDVQRRLIDVKRDLCVNRVNIHLALGGEPKASTSQEGV